MFFSHEPCLVGERGEIGESGLPLKKLKTLMQIRLASRVVVFQEALHHANAIDICYYK